jgi:hypothetical protein
MPYGHATLCMPNKGNAIAIDRCKAVSESQRVKKVAQFNRKTLVSNCGRWFTLLAQRCNISLASSQGSDYTSQTRSDGAEALSPCPVIVGFQPRRAISFRYREKQKAKRS